MDCIAFVEKVYQIVAQIPVGKVTTYGRIAVLAGYPKNSRYVGRALRFALEELPCHRVVNAQGKTVAGWLEQRRLLEKEGVVFKPNGAVDFRQSLWR